LGSKAVSVADHSSALRAPSPSRGEGEKDKKGVSLVFPSPLEGEGAPRADEGAVRSKTQFAKHLRRNMTDVEKKLWSALRDRRFEHFKFRRQVPVGRYIVDFVCQERSVIVELDGSQHEGSTYDLVRDAWLRSIGYNVLRFWNIDVNQALDGVLITILEALNQPLIRRFTPPSPSRGEGKEEKNL
jgi:very-short-patch-repair endonuclease